MEATFEMFSTDVNERNEYVSIMKETYVGAKQNMVALFGGNEGDRKYIFNMNDMNLIENLRTQFKYNCC